MSPPRPCLMLPLLAMLLLPACSRKEASPFERFEYSASALAASRTGPELEGHKLYAQKCSVCHVGNAGEAPFGGWMSRDRLTLVGKTVARERIMNGSENMPGWKYTLSSAQVDQILAHIQTITTSKTVIPPPQARKDLSER